MSYERKATSFFEKITSAAILSALFCTVLATGGCDSRKLERKSMLINGRSFSVEIARTDEEKSQGLMYRKSLGTYEGMLFVYAQGVSYAFWMKNTELPLSIAFISRDGRIVDIKDMEPFSETPVYPASSYMYALEVNMGMFDRLQVRIGDSIALPKNLRGGS
jgi:uncharacterized membrane protein (UPF0127 family)